MKITLMISILFSSLIFCQSTNAFFDTYKRKMNPHEEGSWNWFFDNYKEFDRATGSLVRAVGTTTHHRKMGATHDHSEMIPIKACNLYVLTRKYVQRKITTRVKLPDTLANFRDTFRNVLTTAKQTRNYKTCHQLTSSDRTNLYRSAYYFQQAKDNFINTAKARSYKYRDADWSNNVTIEMSPFPFRVDVISGQFFVKYTGKIAGVTVDSSRSRVQRTGLKYLMIKSGSELRIYAVGNRRLVFDVPRSTVEINGNTMIITYKDGEAS